MILMVIYDFNYVVCFFYYMIVFKKGMVIKEGIVLEVMILDILKQVFQIDVEIVIDFCINKFVCLIYDLIKNEKVFVFV